MKTKVERNWAWKRSEELSDRYVLRKRTRTSEIHDTRANSVICTDTDQICTDLMMITELFTARNLYETWLNSTIE